MKSVVLVFVVALTLFACDTEIPNHRQHLDLAGQWQLALDTAEVGVAQKWYASDLKDSIQLPGTTDLSQKGFLNTDTTTLHLNRLYKYEGVAWYRKKVIIPSSFANKHLTLHLERTKPSRVWIDNEFIGESKLLQSPQEYDVTATLSPGEHYVTILVNNDLKLTPYGNVHIYSDETQTNWNGIIGDIYVEASAKTFISNVQVYPNIDNQTISIQLGVENPGQKNAKIELLVEKTVNGKTTRLPSHQVDTLLTSQQKLVFKLGDEAELWDDYHQPLYELTVVISNDEGSDSKTVPFAMRRFSANGTQFNINGRTTFLRGKHDAAVFPLTGHTPTGVDDWARVYRIAKSYGINHYRFHSYCPPEAAFTAADQEGIFLQIELPFWGGLDSDSIALMLRQEGFAMLKAYGNHPSLVMVSHGNEIWSGHDRVELNTLALKEYDPRPLYTMGSNNGIGYISPLASSDFFVGARTPFAHDTTMTHVRLTHAFADSRAGGILNTTTPNTLLKFDYAVSHIKTPIISHEIGQYQIFPNYAEMGKYVGVLKPWNLEVFRKRLEKAGLAHKDSAFQKASGAWSAICYKAEMEAAIRTPGIGGFQLLDLQDFPGQGTALVGVLDAFMDSKNVIAPEEWKQSCNDVVLLAEFSKYCWTADEAFHAEAKLANYSNVDFSGDVIWELTRPDGTKVKDGRFADVTIKMGGISTIGDINASLDHIAHNEKLQLKISDSKGTYMNTYPIWVYKNSKAISKPASIIVTKQIDQSIFDQLKKGANVLFFPRTEAVSCNSYPGLFPPEFWNYGMFKGISEYVKKPVSPGTLGLLTSPGHPIFRNFPTDFHTNWQWFSIIRSSNSLILDATAPTYEPIVQVIDNLERNHKLGLIFEFKVGEGRMLVCMAQLDLIMDKPEAVALYQSIIDYMQSNAFNPNYEISPDQLVGLFCKQKH